MLSIFKLLLQKGVQGKKFYVDFIHAPFCESLKIKVTSLKPSPYSRSILFDCIPRNKIFKREKSNFKKKFKNK